MRSDGAQDSWISSLRPQANRDHDWFRPHSVLMEEELDATRRLTRSLVVFLVNRECPWKCLECDLWKWTTLETVPPGAIPSQIKFALTQASFLSLARSELSAATSPAIAPGSGPRCSTSNVPSHPGPQIKLYNSGSFFDPRAVPPADDPSIASLVDEFTRVIVESHPAFVGERCWSFRERLRPRLEVAMGLETVHPEILPRLNKRMTLDDFARAAAGLREHDVDVRAFLLLRPPYMAEDEVVDWTRRGVDFAFANGVFVVSLIPTRFGNGALEKLADAGHFAPPSLKTIERSFETALADARGRVFLDLWDLEKFANCPWCLAPRRERLSEMNRLQSPLPPIRCERCAHDSTAL